MLLSTPFIHGTRKRFPDAHLCVLLGSWSTDLLRGNPDADQIIACDLPWLTNGTMASWKCLFPSLSQVRARSFDRIFTLPVSFKTAAFARLCGGRERWGFNTPKSCWAWSHIVSYSWEKHVVDCYMDLIPGSDGAQPSPCFRLFPEAEDQTPVRDLLNDVSPAVILGVTARKPSKHWATTRWASVADHIADRGYHILINGGPSERDYVEAIRSHMRTEALSLAGRFSLLQSAELLKGSTCLVTIDSFPMHLGAAVRTPMVALFGPTCSRQWGPYPNGQHSIVVQPPPEIPRNAEAMRWIQVHHVTEAFDRLLTKIDG